MKNILMAFILVFIFNFTSFAEYDPNKVVSSDDISTKMITTTDFVATMHQSWDLDFDSMNDCKKDGTCDDSIDYTKAKIYDNSSDFLKSEGSICISATDGCNSVSIFNGELGAMTMMYCEDIYGTNGKEKWSCRAYDESKINELKNIGENTDVQNIICTMDYTPVCGVNLTTYSNKCMAQNNEILYNGECEELVDLTQYIKYNSKKEKLYNILKNVQDDTKLKLIERINKMIENTKLQRIAIWVQKERITTYIFLRQVIIDTIK